MGISLDALAEIIGGETRGDRSRVVTRLLPLDETDGAALSPLFQGRLLEGISALPGAVLTNPALVGAALSRGIPGAVVHASPALLLARAIDHFHPPLPLETGVHETAAVHPSATVDETAHIGPFAVIGAKARVGKECVVGAHAVIGQGCALGNRVVIGPGAVIGHDGFGFVPTPKGARKIRHVGRVVVEDDVEIGANTCIDRATLGTTRVCRGAKLDNLVQIGHNATIGEGVLVAGQAGVAGSARIDAGAMLGGQAGIADHLTVGAGARVAAKSGVIGDVPPGEVVAGYPAMPRKKWLKAMAYLKRISIVGSDAEEP